MSDYNHSNSPQKYNQHMKITVLLQIYIIACYFEFTYQQTSPIWSSSSLFYAGSGVAQLDTSSIERSFTITTPFPISTSRINKPFFGLRGVDRMLLSAKKIFFWHTKLVSGNSTLFALIIGNTNGSTIRRFLQQDPALDLVYGFSPNVNIGYTYLLISSIFPSIYYSNIMQIATQFNIASGMNKIFTYSLTTLSSPDPAPLVLSSSTTFLHTLGGIDLTSTKLPLSGSFNLQFKFKVTSSNTFSLTISGKYPCTVGNKLMPLSLRVFIYNQVDFQSRFFRLESKFFNFAGLALGLTSTVQNVFSASYSANMVNFMYGVSGIQLNGYLNIGFQISIPNLPVGKSVTFVQNNMYATGAIPNVQLVVVLPSQKVCPNGQLFIDPTLSTCYPTACPTQYYATLKKFALTETSICQILCDYTCLTCSLSLTNCTSCDALANRLLTSNKCPPKSHYYDTGAPVAIVCDSNCLNCITTATNCTSCNNYAYQSGQTCINCTTYDINCLTCTTTGCSTCVSGYMISGTNCVDCQPSFGSSCVSCTLTACTACTTDSFYPDYASNCTLCSSKYSSLCLTCNNLTCTLCSPGYFFSSSTNACETCQSLFGSACLSCTSSSCSGCPSDSFIPASSTNCSLCSSIYSSLCLACNSSACTLCSTGYFFSSSKNTCETETCQSLFGSACISCTPSNCSDCTNDSFLPASSNSCSLCSSTYSSLCLTCDSTTCTLCSPNYVYSPAGQACVTCSSLYTSSCIQCDSTGCLTCVSGSYFSGVSCVACSGLGAQCVGCDDSGCLQCNQGYGNDILGNICVPIICGYGVWILNIQTCDDGNILNLDGCDSSCNIQPDYACDIADLYPNGTSLCKYTKNISVSLNSIQKLPSSNQLQVIFDIFPSTMKQWNSQSILALISPVQVFDRPSNTSTLITIDSLTYSHNPVTNQIQLLLSYSTSLQNNYLFFNVQPNTTNISSIQNQSSAFGMMVQLKDQNNGQYFYSYDQSVYDMQKMVGSMAMAVGVIAMIMAYVGMCMPSGKLIVLEGLAVVQISYFSLFQFSKLPPTFIGLCNLIYSNAYNDPQKISSISTSLNQSIYSLLGISFNSTTLLSNYNLGFIILFASPLVAGLIGLVVCRLMDEPEANQMMQNQDTQKEIQQEGQEDEPKTQVKQQISKFKILKIIFQRFVMEVSLYGLLLSGYLLWTCSALSTKTQDQTSNYIFMGILICVWIAFSILFYKNNIKSSPLQPIYTKAQLPSPLLPQNHSILHTFGQFPSIFCQITSSTSSKLPSLYFIIFAQKLVVPLMIVYLAEIFGYVGVILIAVYLAFIVGMLLARYKYGQQKMPSLISYLYQNYALRQIVNFTVIIIIQLLYVILRVMIQSQDTYETFAVNSFTTKALPLLVLTLLLVSLLFNIFLFIWQIKSSQLLTKCKLLLQFMFPSMSTSLLQIKTQPITQKSHSHKQITKQEDEIQSMMDSFLQNSPIFQPQYSPFLGKHERQQKKELFLQPVEIDINKEQVVHNKIMPKFQDLKKHEIDQIYDEI